MVVEESVSRTRSRVGKSLSMNQSNDLLGNGKKWSWLEHRMNVLHHETGEAGRNVLAFTSPFVLVMCVITNHPQT